MSQPASKRPEGLEVNTTKEVVGRPTSGHVRRASLSPSLSMMTIPTVSPEPVYIAPAAAANIVTSEVVTQFALPFYEDDAAEVAPSALALINSFLDRLLFNFLSASHSTSLASLRPAVTEVLKPRLAKEAIQSADEELQEYIGGDEDELDAFHNGQDEPHKWDLDLIWKRTRLRCMVYTRLGDMEEDDEDTYIYEQNLEETEDESGRVSRDIGIVSPAVAIFLTSILEFVGEHALMIAAHASYRRHEVRARLEGKGLEDLQTLSIEDVDMEKVAFNPIMGRLWRSWRKFIRSPRDSRVGTSQRTSLATNELPEEIRSVDAVLEEQELDPEQIALPMGDFDVDEIEVPGFIAARTADRGDNSRPHSAFVPGDWMDRIDAEEVAVIEEYRKDGDEEQAENEEEEEEEEAEDKDEKVERVEKDGKDGLDELEEMEESDEKEKIEKKDGQAEEIKDYKVKREEPKKKKSTALDSLPRRLSHSFPLLFPVPIVHSDDDDADDGETVKDEAREEEEDDSNEDFKTPDEQGEDRQLDHAPPARRLRGEKPKEMLVTTGKATTDKEVTDKKMKDESTTDDQIQSPVSPLTPGEEKRRSQHYPKRHSHAVSEDAEDPLHFDSGDYTINEHDRVPAEPTVQPPSAKSGGYPDHETSFFHEADDQYSTSTHAEEPPLPIKRIDTGRVSPVDRRSIRSGEVSPIEPSDDESDGRSKPKPLTMGGDSGSVTPPMVSPLEQPSPPRMRKPMVVKEQEPVRPRAAPVPPPKKEPSPVRIPSPIKKPAPPAKEIEVKPATPPKQISPAKIVSPRRPSPPKDTPSANPHTLQARQRRTDSDAGKEFNREAYVVDEEREGHYRNDSSSSILSAQDLQPDGTIKKRSQEPTGPTPNLAPLREMVEGAHDTSDETSSHSASQRDTQSQSFGPRDASLTAASVPLQKTTERQRQVSTPVPQPGVDMAGVQRVSPAQVTRDSYPQSGRVSEQSTTRGSRSLSQRSITKRIVSGGADKEYRDSTGSHGSAEGGKAAASGPQADKFEQLMESGETMKYTLTPQNMRDIESRNSMVATQVSPPTSPATPTKAPNARGIRTSPVADRTAPRPRTMVTPATNTVTAQQTASNGPSFAIYSSPVVTRRVPQQQPRDARVHSTAGATELAEFIRTTGPPGEPPAPASRAAVVETKSSQMAREQGKIRTKRPRLQARSPVVKGGETTELAEFIRRGPAGGGGFGARVPRGGVRSAVEPDNAPSVTSTIDSMPGRSIQSSTNSRTALIDPKRNTAPPSAAADPRRGPMRSAETADGTTRKQYRNKDPYAIDISDDELDDISEATTIRNPPARSGGGGRDQSMMDFLNSEPPPPPTSQPQALNLSEATIREHQAKFQARAGAGLSSPPAGSTSFNGSTSVKSRMADLASRATRPVSRDSRPPPPAKTGEEGGGMRSPLYDSMARATPAPVRRPMMAGSVGRPPAPRGAGQRGGYREDDNSVRDLANFLKENEPPPGNNDRAGVNGGGGGDFGSQDKPGGGFGRMFSRKKGKA